MKKNLLYIFTIWSFISQAQTTNISGIINQYSKVTAIDKCQNQITVQDITPFAVGDTVLIIQMSGTNINNNNTSFYGNIDNYNSCGNYEFAHIGSIVGNTITFTNVLERGYEANGLVQLISVPTYVNANINGLLTCQPWNGATGGVTVVKAQNRITLNNDIDVSGRGFRGADTISDDCFNLGFGGSNDYRCSKFGACGARKGEGICTPDTTDYYGKGPMANGGGGGNDHNSGGGGGGNYGAGGLGGDRINASTFSCPGGNPGIGGRALQYDIVNNKIYMGGGGGAGDGNNFVNTTGANGGGIVILVADELEAVNRNIFAKGDTVRNTAAGDGAGGGGAGGTVVIKANTFFTNNLTINVSGGKGGNVNNGFDPAANRCMGPGGGGGGGAVWYSVPSTPVGINVMAFGGATGITSWAGAHPSCVFSSNGGRDGDIGGSLYDLNIVESNRLYIPQTFSVCCNTTICKGESVLLTSNHTGTTPLSISWNTSDITPTLFSTPNNTFNFIATATDGIGCVIIDNANVIVETINLGVYAAPSDTILEGTTVTLNAILTTTDTITWIPSTGLSDIHSKNPTFTATDNITYCAFGETTNGCKDTDCVTIIVKPKPDTILPFNLAIPDAFTPNGDGKNDEFTLFYSGNHADKEFNIFNRWGELVFVTNDLNKGWNGKFKGADQPLGTYVYYLILKNASDNSPDKKYTGSLTLIR